MGFADMAGASLSLSSLPPPLSLSLSFCVGRETREGGKREVSRLPRDGLYPRLRVDTRSGHAF